MTALTAKGIPVSIIGTRPCAVYRLFGDGDRLLYVGISHGPSARIAVHAVEKEWGHLIRRATVTWYPSRRDGSQAESAAVREENPDYNLVRFAPRQEWRRAKSPLDHIPEAVTEARERAGLTKTALAKRLGCALTLVCQIENGKSNATPAMLIRLAKVLRCPQVELERKRYSHVA